jgi:hypothetical protein
MPIDNIDRNHPVYTQALEFAKAQDILYGICMGKPAENITTYLDILQLSANRIVSS